MDFSIRLHPHVVRQIAGWGLSDFMLVEIYIRLRESLGQSPTWHLQQDPNGGPGSMYAFEARDPGDPDFQQIFVFRVFFDQDEKHLNVVSASYWRNFDPRL